jgi:hypothetical protein
VLFTPREFDFLWEMMVGAELPYPLEVRSAGTTLAERAVLREQTLGELAARGVLSSVQARTRTAELFGVVAAGEVSVDALQITAVGAHPLTAIASAAGGRGVLMVRDDRGFQLSEIPADGLASAVVALLPTAARGQEKSITMPLDKANQERAGAPSAGAPASGQTRNALEDDQRVLARLNAQPRLRGGQFGVNIRDPLGGGVRRPVLSWFDTDSGRYLTQASRSRDGMEWITVAPADTAALRSRLNEMLRR